MPFLLLSLKHLWLSFRYTCSLYVCGMVPLVFTCLLRTCILSTLTVYLYGLDAILLSLHQGTHSPSFLEALLCSHPAHNLWWATSHAALHGLELMPAVHHSGYFSSLCTCFHHASMDCGCMTPSNSLSSHSCSGGILLQPLSIPSLVFLYHLQALHLMPLRCDDTVYRARTCSSRNAHALWAACLHRQMLLSRLMADWGGGHLGSWSTQGRN